MRVTVVRGIFDQIPNNRRLSGKTPPIKMLIPKICDAFNTAYVQCENRKPVASSVDSTQTKNSEKYSVTAWIQYKFSFT